MKWINADDLLPKPDALIIVCTTGGDVEPAYFNGKWFISVDPTCDAGEALDVQHWMAMPSPPPTGSPRE